MPKLTRRKSPQKHKHNAASIARASQHKNAKIVIRKSPRVKARYDVDERLFGGDSSDSEYDAAKGKQVQAQTKEIKQTEIIADFVADKDALLVFSVDGEVYKSRIVIKRVVEKATGKEETLFKIGLPFLPMTQSTAEAAVSSTDVDDGSLKTYPVDDAAECVELAFASDGRENAKNSAELNILQTRSKFRLETAQSELRGIPLVRCTMPSLPSSLSAGRLWLEVIRQLCLRFHVDNLELLDVAEFQIAPKVEMSLSIAKFYTEHQTWYERELHAHPSDESSLQRYKLSKERVRVATAADLFVAKDTSLIDRFFELAELDGGAPVQPSDAIGGRTGVFARMLAAARSNWPKFRSVLRTGLTEFADSKLLDDETWDGACTVKLRQISKAINSTLNILIPKAWKVNLSELRDAPPILRGVRILSVIQ